MSNCRKTESKDELFDNFFRFEAGKIIAALTRRFGLHNIETAEDVVQDALLKALQQWSYKGTPDNPSGWIMQVAKNGILDILRHADTASRKHAEFAAGFQDQVSDVEADLFADTMKDDQLCMIFACCHPSLSTESQVALTLRTVCGFSIGEIARGLLASEDAIAKRLVRAKQSLRNIRDDFCIPSGESLTSRMDSVLHVIYLVFNEGYKASEGDKLIRTDLCAEAIRLAQIVLEHPAGELPRVYALLALMYFHTARFPARLDQQGELCLLEAQDRTAWDWKLIELGFRNLDLSSTGDNLSSYHLQAGIAAIHCAASDFASTDWKQILSLYDVFIGFDRSPVVALNRAIVFGRVHGPGEALKLVEQLADDKTISTYYLTHAVFGDLYFELGDYKKAATHFRTSLGLARNSAECRFLPRNLAKCEEFNRRPIGAAQ